MANKYKIAIVTTSPMIVRVFLASQINALVELYDVTVIVNLSCNKSFLDNLSKKVNIINLPINRDINFFLDIKSLFYLFLILRANKFTLVHSVSPKSGLLTSVASYLSRTPIRLHTFTGQVWATKNGFIRWFLKFIDKIIVIFSTIVLTDSASQQDFLIKEGVLSKHSSIVLGNGSISGVDIERFKPSKRRRNVVRKQLSIESDRIIFLFIGRLKKEKGLFELANAFRNAYQKNPNIVLLIIGPDEDKIQQKLIEILNPCKESVRFLDFVKNPEYYMAASDVFVLPSYREGFGNVIIESASCGVPSIGSNIYGLTDAIEDKETGLLVPAYSDLLLKEAILKLADNDKIRNKMGLKARLRTHDFFSHDLIVLMFMDLYKKLFNDYRRVNKK